MTLCPKYAGFVRLQRSRHYARCMNLWDPTSRHPSDSSSLVLFSSLAFLLSSRYLVFSHILLCPLAILLFCSLALSLSHALLPFNSLASFISRFLFVSFLLFFHAFSFSLSLSCSLSFRSFAFSLCHFLACALSRSFALAVARPHSRCLDLSLFRSITCHSVSLPFSLVLAFWLSLRPL